MTVRYLEFTLSILALIQAATGSASN